MFRYRQVLALTASVSLSAGALHAQAREVRSSEMRSSETRGIDTLRLTRSQAIAMALRVNPQIAIAREQLVQARAQRVQGNSVGDPVLTASLDSVTGLRRAGAAPQRPVALSASIPFPDKLRLRNRIGTSNVDAVMQASVQVQQQLASQAAQTYDAVLVARLHRQNAEQSRQFAREFLQRTEARFNAGTVPRLDVVKAQVDLAQAENELIASARDVANADAALNRVVGRALGAMIEAIDSLVVPEALPSLAEIESMALQSRPELRALLAQQRGARAASTLVREDAVLPDLTVGAGRDAAVPSGYAFTVGISMPIPVLFWQHTRGEFAETQSRERELAATYRDQQAAVAQDVRAAFAIADAARRQAVFLRDALLPSAREAYRIASVSYGLGGLSALDVLDARRTLLSAQTEYADALAAASSARSDLERAAGVALSSFPTGVPRE